MVDVGRELVIGVIRSGICVEVVGRDLSFYLISSHDADIACRCSASLTSAGSMTCSSTSLVIEGLVASSPHKNTPYISHLTTSMLDSRDRDPEQASVSQRAKIPS